jgi:hypothetical protein
MRWQHRAKLPVLLLIGAVEVAWVTLLVYLAWRFLL